jgi:hypothetical protein
MAAQASQLGAALLSSLDTVSTYGGAQEGDCTLLDVWYPVARCLQASKNPDTAWAEIAATARDAAAKVARPMVACGLSSLIMVANRQRTCTQWLGEQATYTQVTRATSAIQVRLLPCLYQVCSMCSCIRRAGAIAASEFLNAAVMA